MNSMIIPVGRFIRGPIVPSVQWDRGFLHSAVTSTPIHRGEVSGVGYKCGFCGMGMRCRMLGPVTSTPIHRGRSLRGWIQVWLSRGGDAVPDAGFCHFDPDSSGEKSPGLDTSVPFAGSDCGACYWVLRFLAPLCFARNDKVGALERTWCGHKKRIQPQAIGFQYLGIGGISPARWSVLS